MENNKKRGTEEESRDNKDHDQKSGSGNAANIDAIIGSATDGARAHRHTDTWSNQGANISYEGATAPGGGGSVGTGQASGQDAVGARISSDDGHDHANAGSDKEKGEDLARPEEQGDELDRDTMGTP